MCKLEECVNLPVFYIFTNQCFLLLSLHVRPELLIALSTAVNSTSITTVQSIVKNSETM